MKKTGNRILALLLVITILVTGGCGKTGDASLQGKDPSGTNVRTAGANNGMGRYVEEEMEFPKELEHCSSLFQQEDGSILCYNLDAADGLFRAKNKEAAFEPETEYALERKDWYIASVVFSTNGDAVFTVSEEEINEAVWSANKFSYIYKEASDGKEHMLEMEAAMPDGTFDKFAFAPDGTLYAADNMGKVYQIDKDGGQKELFTADCAGNLTAGDKYIITAGWDKIEIYDRTSDTLREDTDTLNKFFSDQAINLFAGYGEQYAILFKEEKDSILFVCKAGLFRYVVGGNVIEQIIDGNLGMFSNPTCALTGFLTLEDGSIQILYSGRQHKRIHYVYREDIPSTPDSYLQIYSLREEPEIRRAVSQYQKEHIDVYIRYEVGMPSQNGLDYSITYEDALKNLNTRILAGKGPDVLILDDMPVDTYIGKGLLCDLSQEWKEINDADYLTNIMDAFRKEDRLFAVPLTFSVPLLLGKKEVISSVTNVKELGDVMEKVRKEQREGSILKLYTPKIAFSDLAMGMWPMLVDKEGIDKEKLSEFLMQVKRIYEIETEGLTEVKKQEHSMRYDQIDNYNIISKNELSIEGYLKELNYELGYCDSFSYGFDEITSMIRKNPEQFFVNAPADGKMVFCPGEVVGIVEGSQQKETAVDFLKMLLSEEYQKELFADHFPVNRKAIKDRFNEFIKTPEDGGTKTTIWNENNEEVTVKSYPLNEAECQQAMDMIEKLNTPDIVDMQTKELILELSEGAIDGSRSVEETVNEIISRMQISLEE